MAMIQAQSFCIIHPDSEFDDSKFSFSDSQVRIEAPLGDPSGGVLGSDPAAMSPPSGRRTDAAVFDRVFPPKTSQEKVFQVIAKTAVLAALENFSSAAFLALGATGGGKTFTVTGGAKRFADRGLIPRSISALFEALCARPDREEVEVSVSFYELYKDGVVDLLSEKRRRVALQPGERGPVLVGLLKQAVATESDAYHLLFQGDSNRHFERMPMNAETSRGHVFYVLHLAHPRTGRKATLSFIDLAAVVNTRNQATTAIAQSIDALKASVAAIHAGTRPTFENSPLTQLLQPWMQPAPGSDPVHVALISPVRYVVQMQRELHEWLRFAGLFQEAMRGQPSRTERRDLGGLAVGGPGGLAGHSVLDWRGAVDQDRLRLAAERTVGPELLVPPLPKHPDGPFAPGGLGPPPQERVRLRKDSEATLPARQIESEGPEIQNLGETTQPTKMLEASTLLEPHRADRHNGIGSPGATSPPVPAPLATLQVPQQRGVAAAAPTALRAPATSSSGSAFDGSGSGAGPGAPLQPCPVESRGNLATSSVPSASAGLYQMPTTDSWQPRATAATTTLHTTTLGSGAVGSAAAPSAAAAVNTRPTSPHPGRISPMVRSTAATPQPPFPPPHAHHLFTGKSVDASWGTSSHASSRSGSPMATRGGEMQAVPRTNVYAQPAAASHMSQPVGSGMSLLSSSPQQGRVTVSSVYSRPVSPQPHARTAGAVQQAWSPQATWTRTTVQSRSPSPQPCAAQPLPAGSQLQTAPRSVSPQPGRLAGTVAAPPGPPRAASPLPGGACGYGAALGSYAPPRADSRPGAVSPMPMATAGALQLDRAPTPLRTPLASSGPVPLRGRPGEGRLPTPAPLQGQPGAKSWQADWQAPWTTAGGGLLR